MSTLETLYVRNTHFGIPFVNEVRLARFALWTVRRSHEWIECHPLVTAHLYEQITPWDGRR